MKTTECNKCDDRGMIQDDKYSAHSCDCGKYGKIMREKFKDVSIEDLLNYANLRTEEKGRLSGKMLGSIKTEKKSKSSAENGKKGGRPKRDIPGFEGTLEKLNKLTIIKD